MYPGHNRSIGRVHRIIALAMVQLAIFLQSCLKLGYSEACAIHLGRIMSAYNCFLFISWFLACDGSSLATLCTWGLRVVLGGVDRD